MWRLFRYSVADGDEVLPKESSQVKSSQVQISMAAAPAAFGAPAGARDREGAVRRNWHLAWLNIRIAL